METTTSPTENIPPNKYVSTVSFSLIYAGLFCTFVYFCSGRGENAYYSLVASDSAILLGMIILMLNIFILAMNSNSFLTITLTTFVMIAILGSLAIEMFLLIKYKNYITDENFSEGFWKFTSISLILTTVVIGIFSMVFFKETNAELSLLTLSGLSIFSFFKVVVTNFLNEMLVYFRADGFRTYLLE